jgi:hypothetical protein
MFGVSPRAGAGASEATDICVAKNVSDPESDWFPTICRELLPKDAGFALHVLTGIEERSCYRYASGASKPSAHLIRTLLRSDQGSTWLNAIMDGTDAPWFRDLQRAERIAAAIKSIE